MSHGITRRLVELILAIVAAGLALLQIAPVAATILTPGWLETADVGDWAAMVVFLCGALAFLFLAWRLARPRSRPAQGFFSARDWRGIAALSLLATIAAAVASHWVIALPGLLPTAVAAAMARRRARQESVARPPDQPIAVPTGPA